MKSLNNNKNGISKKNIKIKQLESKLQDFEKDNKNYIIIIEELSKKNADKIDLEIDYKSKLKELNISKENLENKLSLTKKALTEKDLILDENKNKINDLEKKLRSLEEENKNICNIKIDLEEKLNFKEKELKSSKQKNNNSSQLTELIKKNENLLKEIEVLNSIKKENNNLKEEISELNQEIKNLIHENQLTTEINKELRDFNEENNNKDFVNKSKIKQLQEEIAIYIEDLNAIKSDQEKINNTIIRIRKERNEIKEINFELEEKIKEINEENSELKIKRDLFEKKMNKYKKKTLNNIQNENQEKHYCEINDRELQIKYINLQIELENLKKTIKLEKVYKNILNEQNEQINELNEKNQILDNNNNEFKEKIDNLKKKIKKN